MKQIEVVIDSEEGGPQLLFAADDLTTDQYDLLLWWLKLAADDFAITLPKAAEYGGSEDGSADLRVMGYALAELCGMHDAPDAIKLELGCWFYALGKISRLISDYKQAKPGKADTWFDTSIYSTMARRIQAVGRWP